MKIQLLFPFFLLLFALDSCHKNIKSEEGGLDIISTVYFDASKDLNQMQSFHLSKMNYLQNQLIELVPDHKFSEINKQVYYIKDSLCYLSPYYDGEIPSVKEFIKNSPKLIETMNLIQQNKRDMPDYGQIIYSELAVSEFPKIKDYIITEVGYKPAEIGVITGATSKPNRLKIQDDFNAGKVKIILGSEAIQEGMNLQQNTTDLYMLSLPYNFTTLRQVEGRAWRQGNKHENVRVNFMLTNDSIDVFMLQKLQSKQARYLEAMKKGANVLDISDISTQELKTSIITNPETRANIEIEILKRKIESEKNKHLSDNAFVLRKYENFLKVQEMVTKAQHSYNRILGYSKDETENAGYWRSQLPSYQKTIDLAKAEVQKTIEYLAEKGVNVKEIEFQTKTTDEKITELDKKLEELLEIKQNLIVQYKKEKNEMLRANELLDIIKDRAVENKTLFASSQHLSDTVTDEKCIGLQEKESKSILSTYLGMKR